MQILLVKHGDQWLARLPMVAGLEPQLAAAVAPDDGSVALQECLAGVRDAAVDLTARRAMLLGRLKARIAAGQFAEAEQLLKELRQLPSGQGLHRVAIPGVKRAITGDAATQAKLDAALGEFERCWPPSSTPRRLTTWPRSSTRNSGRRGSAESRRPFASRTLVPGLA